MTPRSQGSDRRSTSAQLGEAGEALVAAWLVQEGWTIEARRWRCRAGELDLVARSAAGLAFVEVKTRSPGNWDAGGALAIGPAKQAKLLQAALTLLAERSDWAELPWRFDVALVARARLAGSPPPPDRPPEPIAIGQPLWFQGQALTLVDYWPGAIEGN